MSGKRKHFSRADDVRIQRITTRHFPGGYTILSATGGWFDPARRRFVREESRQILICDARMAEVRRWGRELGAALGQDELLLVAHGRSVPLMVRRRAATKGQ